MALDADPAALEASLTALAARVRLLRIVRGSAITVLAALLAGFTLIPLDSAFSLSVLMRCGLEALWFALIGILIWKFVVRPAQHEIPLEEIARHLEANGSPNLIAALARERQHPAFPAWPSAALAGAAVVALLGAAGLAWVTPGSAEQVRRIVLPWHRPATTPPFEIIVTTGDAVVRRGDPVTLAAYLRPRDANVELPGEATLTIRDNGDERTLAMRPDGTGAFHVTLSAIAQDFEYRVQAVSILSEWHTVRIAEAVELSDDSMITIVPPEYAAGKSKPAITGFAGITALQHSTAKLDLRFSRPAESAVLEFRPEGRNPFEPPDLFTVQLASDRTRGAATIPIRTNGNLRLALVNESGPRKLRTDFSVSVRSIPDSPPTFETIAGLSPQPRFARPGEKLTFAFLATDDLAIDSAELEWTKGTETKCIPIAILGAGSLRVEGSQLFEIPADAAEGDAFRFRLRVRDSRRLAEAGPQEAVFPSAGWFEVKVRHAASPLFQQNVMGQRDSLREWIARATREVIAVRADLEELRKETTGRSPLPLDHGLRLNMQRERIRAVRTSLEAAVKEVKLTVELRSLAASLESVSTRTLRDADDAMQLASADDAALRTNLLRTAAKHLNEASERLEALGKRNERHAQDRLDRWRLGTLAAEQSALEIRIGTPEPSESLAKSQRELLARLQAIVAGSDALGHATAAIASQEAGRFSAETKSLLDSLRELDAGANRHFAGLRQTRLDAIAAAQLELATRIEAWNAKQETALRLAGLAALKPAAFRNVAELLKTDQTVEALTDLERQAQALDRLAGDFEAWAENRADPKHAAVQFAKWQADLRQRYLADGADKEKLLQEQAAILTAFEKLKLPPGADAAAILVHLRQAAKEGAQTTRAMSLVADALTKLGETAPSVPERLTRSLEAVDKLRLEQNAIIDAVERTLRPFDRQQPSPQMIQNLTAKFVTAQMRQQKLAEKLAALDLPGFESRRARTVATSRDASSDLKDGLPYDSVASLGNARRELERLRKAIDGQPVSDEIVNDLASKQAEVLKLILAGGERPTVKQIEPIVALQLEIYNRFDPVVAPEAPGLLLDASDAVKLAKLSLQDGSPHAQMVRRARDAAEALAILADRMNDRETERDRIRRLITNRRHGECEAKKFAGRPLNPDVSTAARIELSNEISELLLTRVGAAGQIAKKKSLELYLRLQSRAEPDRQAAEQRQLADSLAELAALTADVKVLTTRPKPAAPEVVDPAEAYLPTKSRADSLREAARQERELRTRLNGLAAEMAALVKPATGEALAKGIRRQLALSSLPLTSIGSAVAVAFERKRFADDPQFASAILKSRQQELADRFGSLAQALVFAAAGRPVGDSTGAAFSDAAASARQAERLLADASAKTALGQTRNAATLRAEAHAVLEKAGEALLPYRGPPKVDLSDAEVRIAEQVKSAERAMRRAIRELDAGGDRAKAADAMRSATTSLKSSAR